MCSSIICEQQNNDIYVLLGSLNFVGHMMLAKQEKKFNVIYVYYYEPNLKETHHSRIINPGL